jgi:hypothetical protein
MATIKKSKAGLKTKKAQDGGRYTDEDEDSQYNSRTELSAKSSPVKSNAPAPTLAKSSAPAKKQSFGEAFKAARADPKNKGTFSWNGKSYTTETKDEAAKKTAVTKPAASAPASKPATSNQGPLKSKQNPPPFNTGTPNIPSRPPYKSPGKAVIGDGKGALKSKQNSPSFSTKTPNIPSRPAYKSPGLKTGGKVKKKC